MTVIAFLLQQWLQECASLLRYGTLHALFFMLYRIKCQGTVHSQFGEQVAFCTGNSEHGGTKCEAFTRSSQYLVYYLRKPKFLILSIMS